MRSMSTDALATAMAIAEAEGLTLIRADNECGFSHVTATRNRNDEVVSYRVRVSHEGKEITFGAFQTAAEAALCYARHLGPEACWQPAKKPRRKPFAYKYEGFGVAQRELPRKPASPASSVVECRIVGEDEGDDDESAGMAVPEVCTVEGVVEACEGLPSSSNGGGSGGTTPWPPVRQSRPPAETQLPPTPRWKRLRATRTEEFEVQLNAGDETIMLPVPRGVVGGRVRVRIEFSTA